MSGSKPPISDAPIRLVTINQAAEMLGCSRTNIYALIHAGEIAVITVGKSRGYRIDVRDIDEFIRRRKSRRDGRPPLPPPIRPRLKHIKL